MATIFVGNQTEPFVVHHNLITASSGFFAKALNGEFKEKEGIVRLKDQNAEHFSRYIQWLYDGKVLFDRAKENRHKVLMQTILGSFIQDRWYCNALIDALIDDVVKKYSFPSALSREAFAKLPASSPFLKLLVDFWVYVRIPSIT
jgi:hypothetical protein